MHATNNMALLGILSSTRVYYEADVKNAILGYKSKNSYKYKLNSFGRFLGTKLLIATNGIMCTMKILNLYDNCEKKLIASCSKFTSQILE